MCHQAQQRLVVAIYSALHKLWPMSAATRRATAEAIVHEVYAAGIRVEDERRQPSRSQLPPLVPCSLLLCTTFTLEALLV